MKKRLITLIVVVLLVLLGTVYLWGPGNVPAGQQPLLTVSSANMNQFEAAFDNDTEMPRSVLLLSPT